MKTYRKNKPTKTTLIRNESVEGETIEQKIERVVNNKEPISDGAPIIFTERKDGVNPAYDIRTDRFEIAVDAMDKVSKAAIAKREAVIKDINGDGKPESIQGQDNGTGGTENT